MNFLKLKNFGCIVILIIISNNSRKAIMEVYKKISTYSMSSQIQASIFLIKAVFLKNFQSGQLSDSDSLFS